MFRHKFVFPLMAALALAACSDSSPTANHPQLDGASFELVAEAALEANDQLGTPLPSLHNLLRRTYQAIRQQDGHGEGARLLNAGHTLQGIIAVLGPEVAVEANTGVKEALSRLGERFAGHVLPGGMQGALDRAKELAGKSQDALTAGNPAAALGAALASADLIRSLSPRFRARKAIDRATRAFQAAKEVVGDGPTGIEKTALQKAQRFRNGAVEAFKVKHFREAWNYAEKSMAFSHEVLKGRSGG
jgi:hypothetical protein